MRFPGTTASAATVCAAICLLSASPSTAATLVLTGTPGAVVTLDGRALGALPLDGPLTLDEGRHLVTAVRRGMLDLRREVTLAAGETARVHLRMTPLSRKDAALYSLLLAGLGQRYEGRRTLGWALTAVEVGGVLTALVSETSVQNHKDDYVLSQQEYRQAVDADEIERLRAEVEAAHADMQDAASA